MTVNNPSLGNPVTTKDVIFESSIPRSESPPASGNDATTEKILRAAHRKVDQRLVAWHCFLYLLMKFGQNNISNAAIMNLESGHGIKKELGNLSGVQWAWVLSAFWYSYMFFEPMSVILLKKFSPSVWMGRIILTWGIVSTCQAATQNYAGIVVCRFILGAAEAGYWPAAIYHLSFWYHPDKLPLRIGVAYAFGQSAGAISGLIAYGISFIDGARELSGWRWLFIIEGMPPILAGIISYLFLTDYPDTAKFITEEERHAILDHLPPQAPTMHAKTWDTEQAKGLLKDPTFWSFILIWVGEGVGGFGITFTFPNVVYELGFTGTAEAQLATMPPYGVAWLILIGLNIFIRRKKVHAFAVALGMAITQVICYVCLMIIRNSYVKYALLIIAVGCTLSILAIMWSERVRAAKGTTNTGLAIGITNATGCVGGLVGPQIFQAKFGPTYRVSYGICLIFLVLLVGSIVASWYLTRRRYAAELLEEDNAEHFKISPQPTQGGERVVAEG